MLFLIWTIAIFYAIVYVLPHVPAVQTAIGEMTAQALSEKLGTKATVGKVDVRFPDRLVIDDVTLLDQSGKEMLRAGRMSVSIELLPLLKNKVVITSAQLFGSRITLYQKDAQSPLNCQFAIDSLSKKKENSEHTPLDVAISSLVIRNSSVTYDRYDIPQRSDTFSPYHLHLTGVSSHISLEHLTDDSLCLALKELRLEEASGIKLNDMSFNAICSRTKQELENTSQFSVALSDFLLRMPDTKVLIPKLNVSLTTDSAGNVSAGTLRAEGDIDVPYLHPQDLKSIIPADIQQLPPVSLKASLAGTDKEADATITIHSTDTEDLTLSASIKATEILDDVKADILLSKCHLSDHLIKPLADKAEVPALAKVGTVDAKGRIIYNGKDNLNISAEVSTSEAGTISAAGTYIANVIKGEVKMRDVELARLTGDNKFGRMTCNTLVEATFQQGKPVRCALKGDIPDITYDSQHFTNITIDGAYSKENGEDAVKGMLSVKDPRLSFDSDIDVRNLSIDNLSGRVDVKNLNINFGKPASLQHVLLTSERHGNQRDIQLDTDFASVNMVGRIELSNIHHTFSNLISKYLPSLPGIKAVSPTHNEFSIKARIEDLSFLKTFADIPVEIYQPLDINGVVNEELNMTNIGLDAPSLDIQGISLKGTQITLWTPQGSLNSSVETYLLDKNGKVRVNIDCQAANDSLSTRLTWDNLRPNAFKGDVSLITKFYPREGRASFFDIGINDSSFELGDTVWNVRSNDISYNEGRLKVDHLTLDNGDQYLKVNGIFSDSPEDSVVAELQNLNIRYILDLVNFHSVDFDGLAYGSIAAKAVFGDIDAAAALDVQQFRFEQGRMGTLHVNADYTKGGGQINIDAIAEDPEADGRTLIKGYVEPSPGSLDLYITAENSRLEFMQSFCGSFLNDIDLHGSGDVRLAGPFKGINMTGMLKADGDVTVIPTNCRYHLEGDTVTFIPDDICFSSVPLTDKYGNKAFLSGHLYHHNLGRMSYDMHVKTDKFLAYDIPELTGDDTYCGTAIVSGDIGFNGSGNEVKIDADVTTLKGSYIIYDASSTNTLVSRDFIEWGSVAQKEQQSPDAGSDIAAHATRERTKGNERANIRMNFLVNVTPEAKLHLIMDAVTGDYIDLFGSAALHASYYNKGSFDLHGNYEISDGTYHMTIQKLISKDFLFQNGSTIAFGGDPYDAVLQMKALYALNSVPLSDLNMGSSFKSNNVPVNCIMNISGTPARPTVEFDLELPSLSTDAQQMISSVINSAEQMNQQVLYLLAIGRFYAGDNMGGNSSAETAASTGQTSLALQSFLSGTLSQQFNSIMSRLTQLLTKNNSWTFGANVATGNEGMSNAEYEGLLSGRLFNDRLLFDGQFGYRDNVSTNTQNFIGDFTIKYLLTPSGNIALRAYNQANDRYFTKNSLNTQGIGIVFQKEFGK